jgi:sugar fermentation stimulation protein A
MDFPSDLQRGRLVQRYKRFFADVVLDDGAEVTAHCPNPGTMLGLNTPGLSCWLSRSDDPKRKLTHTLELVEVDGGLVGINTIKRRDGRIKETILGLVGVNTARANGIVAEAIRNSAIPDIAGYQSCRAEVRYGEASRVDFLLTDPDRPPCWVEVKSVTMRRSSGLAEFPDCVTSRGSRHLTELENMARGGDRAVMLFLTQRNDCDRVTVARDIDPTFADALTRAVDAGVEVVAYGCQIDTGGISAGERLCWNAA